MSLAINNNSAATIAQRYLQTNNSKLTQSIQRLSSGYRINNAADDPAGLVTSESLRAQIGGLGQAITNSQDAVNLVKTSEGALTEVNSLLGSMRDLAVHAANTGANDSDSTQADQAQIQSAIDSLNRISSQTAFGNLKLLDGSGSLTGAVVDSTNISSFKAATSGSALTGKSGYATIDVTTAATQANVQGAAYASAATVLTGATDLSVNGVSIGSFTTSDTLQKVIDTANTKSDLTGVTAAYTGGKIVFTAKDYGSKAAVTVSDSGGALLAASGTYASQQNGVDAVASITSVGTSTGLSIAFDKGTGQTLQDSNGDTINLTNAGNAVATIAQGIKVEGQALTFQIGANSGETANVSIASTAADQLGTGASSTFASVAAIDVTKNASEAIKVLDSAISQISNQRASLGAFQSNVLESNISSLSVSQENVSASESSIRDTNMASEMVEFTKDQILNQAGTAMLTQANQAPQQLLKLLQ